MEISFLYPDHLEIISGIGLLKDLTSLLILEVSLIHSGTVIYAVSIRTKILQIISLYAQALQFIEHKFSNHDFEGL
jgi:hypothetical protein